MGPVEQQKRELCKQAYLLIHKYLAATGKEGQESFEFRKNLRKKDALDIDLATNKEVLSELNKFKESGGAATLAVGGSAGAYAAGTSTGAAKASKSKGGGSVAAGGGTAAGAKATKSGAKGSVAKSEPPGAMPATLPQKIGAKVNRWWAKENQWYTAVITDYNPDSNEYRLTYNLGSSNETYEDFDLDMADPAVYKMTGERVNLLAKTGSAAVNNSVILQPYLRANAGAASAGGGKAGNKKRRSEDSDSDYGGGS
ncbi:hypothetical protein GPECTOR_15g470 [Gonium pectorale]|uniref:Tudor domain-containing protein n=1 Tax=Gonium pectorale TaxID=33097 RepID=A0A150GM10_GONPE|nr:hypothetical protein GPECTOR_15g470 [Gonium pectorale]|eukprot:KXZ50785.1 hypothetical protein GPECTOR_15g470 [Gonium pectorale]